MLWQNRASTTVRSMLRLVCWEALRAALLQQVQKNTFHMAMAARERNQSGRILPELEIV